MKTTKPVSFGQLKQAVTELDTVPFVHDDAPVFVRVEVEKWTPQGIVKVEVDAPVLEVRVGRGVTTTWAPEPEEVRQ